MLAAKRIFRKKKKKKGFKKTEEGRVRKKRKFKAKIMC